MSQFPSAIFTGPCIGQNPSPITAPCAVQRPCASSSVNAYVCVFAHLFEIAAAKHQRTPSCEASAPWLNPCPLPPLATTCTSPQVLPPSSLTRTCASSVGVFSFPQFVPYEAQRRPLCQQSATPCSQS